MIQLSNTLLGPVVDNPVLICVPLDCAETITGVYGQAVSLHVPREAQYLEFTPVDGKETTVLWNRTSSQVKKGKVKIKGNIIDLYNLTQMENGYYNLRRKDNTLVKRKSLTVKGNKIKYNVIFVRDSKSDVTSCSTQHLPYNMKPKKMIWSRSTFPLAHPFGR